MKRIALADLHFSEYSSDELIDDLSRRLYELKLTFTEVIKYANKNNIKDIDILGDIYNDKNVIYTRPQNLLKGIFEEYSDINFNLIAGNHDFSDTTESTECTIKVFDVYKNVKCYISEPARIGNITIVPFSQAIVKYLKNECEPNSILLSHFGVSDAVLQSGLSIITNISFSDLTNKFKLILLGHYHKPQTLKNDKGVLCYVGTPIHFNWNDKNEDKRFLVYDTETLEVISEPIKWIKEYKEFKIDETNKDRIQEILELAKAEREKGNKVRVRNTVKIEDKDFKNSGFDIIDDTEIDITQRGINSSMSQEDKFKSYLKYKEIPEIDYEEYLKEVKDMLASEVVLTLGATIKKKEKKQEIEKLEIKEEKKIEVFNDDLKLVI